MTTYPNFGNAGLNSNSNEVGLDILQDLNFFLDPQQRQTINNSRNNGSATANQLVSANLTSQPSHNYYTNMLPTPEGSDAIIMSSYNILPGSGSLNAYKEGDFLLDNYDLFPLSPQISPTIPPDASINITSPTSHQNKKIKHHRTSPNINNSISQSRRKSIIINSNKSNNDNGNNSNSPNGQFNANTDLPSIITGSPNKLPSNSIMFSFLELTSPLMNNMVATSIAPSLQEAMPNLNLGGNLVSDATNTHPPTNISDSSDNISPITPSSLMKMKRKRPNSPKSGQNESSSNLQQQQQNQDQSQQILLPSKDNDTTFIAPTPPTQLSQIRANVVVTTGSASPSAVLGRKSIRNASSPLALGPKSPHSLKPTISPSLKPKLPGVIADEVAEQLANKSNYRSILEGTAQSLGISYSSDVHSSLESRRTTHKAAEQKRRDSLKQSFDELKKVVPYQSTLSKCNISDGKNNDNKNNNNGKSDGNMKNVSKLFLLKRAHDYIVELEQKSKAKDELIQKLNDELDELKGIKRRKVEESEKKENAVIEIDTETKSKDEQQTTSSNES